MTTVLSQTDHRAHAPRAVQTGHRAGATRLEGCRVSWQVVDDVLPPMYVGRHDKEFAGLIKVEPSGGFRVTTGRGKDLGVFAELETAQRALG